MTTSNSYPFRLAHVHGFSSSAKSRKGLHLKEQLQRRGHKLILPDLNRPSFEEITFSNALGAIDEMDAIGDQQSRWRISASSMGAYLVALWAAANPEKVDRLVLLCPAFGLIDRFPALVGVDRMKQWEQEGTLGLPGPDETLRPVHWRLIEEGRDFPTHPEVPCPTVIIHGRRDPTIPIDSSRSYAANRDHIRLIEVDDYHTLENSLKTITNEIISHFELN